MTFNSKSINTIDFKPIKVIQNVKGNNILFGRQIAAIFLSEFDCICNTVANCDGLIVFVIVDFFYYLSHAIFVSLDLTSVNGVSTFNREIHNELLTIFKSTIAFTANYTILSRPRLALNAIIHRIESSRFSGTSLAIFSPDNNVI